MGLFEGITESLASLLKYFRRRFDRSKRKPLAIVGYGYQGF
jgi:hypothetical protein